MNLDAAGVESALLILAALILIGPVLAERARLPGLVGLIALGVAFGPSSLGWLQSGGLVAAVGAIGLLYLMFLAGFELDINAFVENRGAALTFGALTFAIPFAASFSVGWFYLDYSLAPSALVGAMWASHTLVAYPEVQEAGVESSPAVGSAVSATVITDILALLVLGIFSSSEGAGEPAAGFSAVMPVWLGVVVLLVFCLWVLPKIADWFFTSVGHTRTQRFIFCLASMAAGGAVSLLGGIEGLVGAFLAGIGLNRQVPARGPLMEHIEFFGAALFVPAFLISVGLSIDPGALTRLSTWQLALIFTGLVVATKTAAAIVSGRILRLSPSEIGLTASLTFGQAAATLAIARVGVDTGIFSQGVFDASVVTVVLTVLVTSVGTRIFARRIGEPAEQEIRLGSRVLVDAAKENGRVGLLQIAVALARPDDGLVTPFVVTNKPDEREDRTLEAALEEAASLGSDPHGVRRIADSLVDGVIDLTEELNASALVLPWDGRGHPMRPTRNGQVDAIGSSARIPVAAGHLPESEWSRVVVVTGRSKSRPARTGDIRLAVEIARRVAARRELPLIAHTPDQAIDPETVGFDAVHRYGSTGGDPWAEIAADDLVVMPSHVIGETSRRVRRTFGGLSLLVVGGPGRLSVTAGAAHDQLGGAVGRPRREPQAKYD